MHPTEHLDRLYVVTRRDLPPGLQAAQAVHGAFAFAHLFPALTANWLAESNFLVVVTAADEFELALLLDRAAAADIARLPVREPDLDDQLMAVVLEPGPTARRLCSSFPLALREVPAMA